MELIRNVTVIIENEQQQKEYVDYNADMTGEERVQQLLIKATVNEDSFGESLPISDS